MDQEGSTHAYNTPHFTIQFTFISLTSHKSTHKPSSPLICQADLPEVPEVPEVPAAHHCSAGLLVDCSLERVSRLTSLCNRHPWRCLGNVETMLRQCPVTLTPRRQCPDNVQTMSRQCPSFVCYKKLAYRYHLVFVLFQKVSDQFTKLNLSFSLDRANLSAYNPWEMVSRLQTIE